MAVFSFRCLILRMNGDLSLLDLDDGRERELTHSVELFWVTCGQLGEKTNLIEEVSWLDYGHRGMQVLVSSDNMQSGNKFVLLLDISDTNWLRSSSAGLVSISRH